MQYAALSTRLKAGQPARPVQRSFALLLLLAAAVSLGHERLDADPPGTASATEHSSSVAPGNASASAGEVSTTTNTDYPPTTQSKGGVDQATGNWHTSITNGNNTATPDTMEFVCNNATVRSKGRLIDADAQRASYIRGQGVSKEEWTYTVTATDEEARVNLKISNPFEFLAKWRGQGKQMRTVNNKAHVIDVNANKHTFELTLTYLQGRTTSTQFEIKASVGAEASKEGKKTSVKRGVSAEATFTRGTQEGADELWNGSLEDSGEAEFSISAIHTVTTTKEIESFASQDLRARAHANENATIHIENFDAVAKMAYNWAIEIDLDEPQDPTPEWQWKEPGDPLPDGTTVNPVAPLPLAACVAPVGLGGQQGAILGQCILRRPSGSSGAITMSLATSPSNSTDLAATVAFHSDDLYVDVPFSANATGSISVTATLLDSQGQPTSTTGTATFVAISLSTLSIPKVFGYLVATDMVAIGGSKYRGIPNASEGRILAVRSGFDDFQSEATQFTVNLTDPSGILTGVPTTLTIAAAQTSTYFDFDLTGTGTATITLTLGADTVAAFTVEGVAKALTATSSGLSIPANAFAPLSCLLPVGGLSETQYSLSVTGSQIVTVESVAGSQPEFAPRVENSGFLVRPTGTTGTCSVVATPTGMSAVTIPITVRAAEVEVTRTAITLLSMSGTAGGDIKVQVPYGASFSAVVPPSGSSSYMSVAGTGTSEVVLTFIEGQTRPSTISISVTLSGAPSGAFDVAVNDQLRGPATSRGYFLAIPAQ